MSLDEVSEDSIVYVKQYGKVKDTSHILRFIEISGVSSKTPIKVIYNNKGYPLIIKVKGNKIAIDRNLAKEIKVGRGRNK